MQQVEMQGYLLMIEDEPIIQANNKKLLERRGFRVRQAYTLKEANEIIEEETPKCITLDLQMPDGDGLDFLVEFRKKSNVPVLILTSRGTHQDIIKGLESGGDDYLPKPYDLQVYLARLTNLMRRASMVPESISVGPINLDIVASRAFLNGVDLRLQQKEFALLKIFAQRPGQVISPDYLYEKVWGWQSYDGGNSLKVTISKLRSHLADTGYTITASKGEGYFLEKC